MNNPARSTLLTEWLQQVVPSGFVSMQHLAGDASFRSYSRVQSQSAGTFLVMDAPPEKESCLPFACIAKAFHKLGLKVPEIFAEDLNNGFLLISDFGDTMFSHVLNHNTVDGFYQRALAKLPTIHACSSIENFELPVFDQAEYLREMEMFREWYMQKHLGITPDAEQNAIIDDAFALIIENCQQQPQVCVHRDYHSRNLMVLDDGDVGILDFQDALLGPITYDALSLLRDCYVDWPEEQVWQWVDGFQQTLLAAGLLEESSPEVFRRWFDWVGLQRNLKCIGLFPRLCYRDNKPGYLQYMPRILHYAQRVCHRQPELKAFGHLLNELMRVPV